MPAIGRGHAAVLDVQLRLNDGCLRGLHRGLGLLDLRGLVHLGGVERGLATFDIGPRALLVGQGVVVVLLRHGALFGERLESLDVLVGLVQARRRDPQVCLRGRDDGLLLRLRQVGLGLRELGLGLHQLGCHIRGCRV